MSSCLPCHHISLRMRNLSLFYSIEYNLNVDGDLRLITLDNTTRVLYTINNSFIYGINIDSGKVDFEFNYIDSGCGDGLDNSIVCIQYLTEMNSIFIGNSRGDLMVLNLFDREVECVGCISDGLDAVEWSPDQELVVLVSSNFRKLIGITKSHYLLF
jgi:hypothetical protein